MESKCLPFSFDALKLQHALERYPADEWIDHFVKQNYKGSWSVLPLRGQRGASHPVMMIYSNPTCTAYEDTPFLQRSPYLMSVLQTFQCELQAVRLMKLKPASQILEHRDHDLDIEQGTARLHIPMQTNDFVTFRLNGRALSMQVGECWYLKLSDPHSVVNDGDSDRIHLVIDATVNDWLLDQISGT